MIISSSVSPRRRRGPVLFLMIMTLLVWSLLVGWMAPPAQAHDSLRSSSPADRSRVPTAPDTVVLIFDQPAIALGTGLVVTGPAGQVQTGSPRLVDTTVTQDLRPGSPAGDYTVTWRVTSADGHPLSGTFTFTAAAANPATAAPVPPTADPSAPLPAGVTTGIPAWVWIAAAAALLIIGVLATRAFTVRRRRSTPRP